MQHLRTSSRSHFSGFHNGHRLFSIITSASNDNDEDGVLNASDDCPYAPGYSTVDRLAVQIMMEMVRLISRWIISLIHLRLNIHHVFGRWDVDHSPDLKICSFCDDSGYLRVEMHNWGLDCFNSSLGDPTTQGYGQMMVDLSWLRPMLRTPSKCTMRVTSHKYMEISLQM